ncbi:MAG: heparinase II/III domain-containing protein, partial [Bacilli bacterium]
MPTLSNQSNSNAESTYPILFRSSTSGVSPIKIADELLNNKLYVRKGFRSVPYTKHIDWSMNPYRNNDSWQSYFQSLTFVSHLSAAYEQEPNIDYLYRAKFFVKSWAANNIPISKGKSPYAWYYSSTSNRTIALLHFYHIYRNARPDDSVFLHELKKLIRIHANDLYFDQNYAFQSNHGIFQDKALIAVSLTIPEIDPQKNYFNHAKDRLLAQVNRHITKNGFHKEHSPGYHMLVITMLREITEFTAAYNERIPKLENVVYRMEGAYALFATQRFEVPILGDSEFWQATQASVNKNTSDTHPYLVYIRSKGQDGKRPPRNYVDAKAGYAIYRNGWDTPDDQYLLFSTAAHSTAHKHADDLQFLFHSNGSEFFTDSGKYLYGKDPFRTYMTSAYAHNVIVVDGKNYAAEQAIGQVQMTASHETSQYFFVRGEHTIYNGVTITRSILYMKETETVLIYDQAKSIIKHSYRQQFNFGPSIYVSAHWRPNTFTLLDTKNK